MPFPQFNFSSNVQFDNITTLEHMISFNSLAIEFTGTPDQCNRDFFNPYINFHCPCFSPVITIDHREKVKRKYPLKEVMTPYERLRSLPGAAEYLASGVTLAKLDAIADQMSDNQFVERMVHARSVPFRQISRFDERVLRSYKEELSTFSTKKEKEAKRKKGLLVFL